MSNFMGVHAKRIGKSLEVGGPALMQTGTITITHDAVAKYKHRLDLPSSWGRRKKEGKPK